MLAEHNLVANGVVIEHYTDCCEAPQSIQPAETRAFYHLSSMAYERLTGTTGSAMACLCRGVTQKSGPARSSFQPLANRLSPWNEVDGSFVIGYPAGVFADI